MKFNRENYELYVIDFLEGKLSEADHILFMKFLRDHPDINQEINDVQNVQLQSTDEDFPGKNILKKNIKTDTFKDDFQNYCIAYLEGDIEYTDKIKFENWILNNPEKANELKLFRTVYLKADVNIIFNQKSRLKRRSIVLNRIRLVSILSTAAAGIILLVIFLRPAGNLNPNIISDSSIDEIINDTGEELKSTTGKEILTEKKEPVNTESGKYQEPQSTKELLIIAESDNIRMENEASVMEKISMKPISSLMAHVETESSVNISGLKKPDPGEGKNFDEYQTIGEYVNKNILSDFFSADESNNQEKLTFWNLALTSLEGINNLTDGGYALNKKTDENGTLKRISVETPLLGISIPVKNKQPQ